MLSGHRGSCRCPFGPGSSAVTLQTDIRRSLWRPRKISCGSTVDPCLLALRRTVPPYASAAAHIRQRITACAAPQGHRQAQWKSAQFPQPVRGRIQVLPKGCLRVVSKRLRSGSRDSVRGGKRPILRPCPMRAEAQREAAQRAEKAPDSHSGGKCMYRQGRSRTQ